MARKSESRTPPAAPQLPAWVAPQLAVLADAAPDGDDWLHEIKYDGYRLLAWISPSDPAGTNPVQLLTRNRKDWTARFADIAGPLASLATRVAPAILDGEAAVEVAGGVTSFQAMQNVLSTPGRGRLQYFVFDALFLNGEDLRRLPLAERKGRLKAVLEGAPATLKYSDHVRGSGPAFHAQACEHGLEGVISKRASAPYRSGRNAEWLKVKCLREQEFVVGGFTEPEGSRTGLGALHVGVYDNDGRFAYRGKVGTGFTGSMLTALRRKLAPLVRADSPFVDPPRGAAVRSTHWVEPEVVVQIRFTDITEDGRLRHPSYQGLRDDKSAADVVEETPLPAQPEASGKNTTPRARRAAASPSSRDTRSPRGPGAGRPTEVAGTRLTSPGRVLYAGNGVTKLALAQHYHLVAEFMLPHVAGRPLTLVRCPSGYPGPCFFQKHMDKSAPDGVRRVLVEERDGSEWYGTVDSVGGLVGLVQLGTLEIHTSNARADRLDRPDRFLIDLDPDEDVDWDDVVDTAFHVRDLLAELGLRSFVKTTGGKGLHVIVPLQRRSGWDEVKAFSYAVVSLLAEAAPDRFTTVLSKKRRRGRIFLDYLRNTEGATAIEAYSTRAKTGATVAVPIEWDELRQGVRSNTFTVETLPQRLDTLAADPWKQIGAVRQSLTAPMKRRLNL